MRHLARMWISATLAFLCCASFAQAQKPQNNPQPKPAGIPPFLMKLVGDYGDWWHAISQEAKTNFIDGYLAAMERTHFLDEGFAQEARKNLTPGPSFDAQMNAAVVLSGLSAESYFDVKKRGILEARLNAFYEEPLNQRIPVELALQHIRDELEGRKTAGQLLDELNDWRKTANRNQ